MDIILGESAVDRSEHARAVVRKIAIQESDPQFANKAIPLGIAHHLARYPHTCDDCGATFWSQDEWGAAHLGCRGEVRNTGF